jgi:rod shape-determining protein MreC
VATSRRTNQRLTLLMLVLASITALTLDYRGSVAHGITHVRNGFHDALSPIQRGISFVLNPVGDVFAGAVHYGSLEHQNQALRTELGNLRRQLETDRFAKSQSEDVLTLAKLPYINGIPWIPAEVIGPATSNFEETLEIDKGTSDGAGPGMPVVGESGLVGVVKTASSHTATVLLVTDASSSIAVRVGTGSGLYRAQGAGRGHELNLSFVGGSTAAKKGELVYTSGLAGGAIPAGIPIGVVASVRSSPTSVAASISVTPIVNFVDLQYVDVLQWMQPA